MSTKGRLIFWGCVFLVFAAVVVVVVLREPWANTALSVITVLSLIVSGYSVVLGIESLRSDQRRTRVVAQIGTKIDELPRRILQVHPEATAASATLAETIAADITPLLRQAEARSPLWITLSPFIGRDEPKPGDGGAGPPP